MRCRGVVPRCGAMWCRGAKYVVPNVWCQYVWCRGARIPLKLEVTEVKVK